MAVTTMTAIWTLCLTILSSYARPALALGKTDTITWGGDNSRAGYETNHNMDPAIVGGPDFGRLWSTNLGGNFNGIGAEQIFSQPLVYTIGDTQYVFIATTQNNIYKLNAKTGAIIAKRNLHVPFLTADLNGCVDINPTVGVTGTGVIDPATGIWYLTAKTYSEQFQNGNFGPNNPPGRRNGRYYFHGINTVDLSEAPNFPTLIDGMIFRNNDRRMFIGGDTHQRPGLLQVGDYIYTGWASHCVQYNFTGAIIGFHRTTGEIIESYAMQGGPEPNTVEGGGVWMSGGAMSYDGVGSMFFSTGNGYASQLPASGRPVQGRNPPTALEQAVVNMRINDDGTLRPVDFFMPWEKTQLDGADKDLGTSPFQLLPQDTFSCPNDRRIGVVTGKSGKTYWLDVDNLGGYQNGPNRLDDAIQVTQNENSVFAGAGVMPMGGGYIYVNVIQHKTHVFKFSCNSQGRAVFTQVADTPETNAYILGVGHGTTTSLDGREGSGLLWTTDVEGLNLRIYDPIPPSDGGDLRLIKSFNIPAVTKFSRPVFGDGIAYVGTTRGIIHAFGSPITLPLNCTSPVSFNRTAIGSTSQPMTVTCKANIEATVTSFNLSGNANFATSGLPALPLRVPAGQSFSFQALFTPRQVGALSSDIVVATTNAQAGFSANTPVSLTGTGNSAAALLAITPNTVSFTTQVGGGLSTQSAFFINNGDATLRFSNVSYSLVSEDGPWVAPNITNGKVQVGEFVFSDVPTTLQPNTRQLISIDFHPTEAGNHAVYVKAFWNGNPARTLNIFGNAGSNPTAVFEFEQPDGSGWQQYVPGQNFTFGNVLQGTTRRLVMRITNNGSATAAPLGLTVSKPPFGIPGIVGAANSIDLAEGTLIPAGQSRNATILCSPPERQVNSPNTSGYAHWAINTNDLVSGRQDLQFECISTSQQVGPTLPNGEARFKYIGCFRDNTPGRQLTHQPYSRDDNTLNLCTQTCSTDAGGWTFAGTQFNRQCWCGHALPRIRGADEDCNFRCSGAQNETCGGNGVFHNMTMISLFADSTKFDGNVPENPIPLAIPQSSGRYNYEGCYRESGGKAFNVRRTSTNSMTVDQCREFCGTTNSRLFGLQFAQECYCGDTIGPSASLVSDTECGMVCRGNNSQYCGAGSRMQAYRLDGTPLSTSTTTSSTTTSSITTSSSTTTSSSAVTTSSTTSSTTSTVSSSSTTLTVTSSASTSSSSSTASTTTSASIPAEPSIPSQLGSYRYRGCFSEIEGRALKDKADAGSHMTNEACQRFCIGSKFFATQYTAECFCGNVLHAGSALVTDGRCNMPCAANSTQICGGPNGLTLFELAEDNSSSTTTSTGAATTSSSSSTSSSATSTSSAAPAGPTVVPSALNFVSQGCHSDGSPRALLELYYNVSMTVEMCARQARDRGFAFMGLEYGTECWMGNSLHSTSRSIDQSNCNMVCPGNTDTLCGAGLALQLYSLQASASTTAVATTSSSSTTSSSLTTSSAAPSTTSSTTSAAPSTTSSTTSSAAATTSSSTTSSRTTTTSSASSSSTTNSAVPQPTVVRTALIYSSSGCHSSKSDGSVLPELYSTTSMTIPVCAREARRGNYTYFGVENANQCRMGNTLDSAAQPIDQGRCNLACPGNEKTFCGASLALQLYRRNDTLPDLPEWDAGKALACPAANQTTWYSTGGSRFRIDCGMDRSGGHFRTASAATYEACLNACETTAGCVSVSLRSSNCYMKRTLGRVNLDSGIRGATLLEG